MIKRHLAAWLVLLLIAIGNGVVRELSYGRYLAELHAHQLSTVLAMLLIALFAWILSRRWPLPNAGAAYTVGATWLGLTVAFEFAFGHYFIGHSWQRLWHDYDLFSGRLWLVFLIWLAAMPYVFYRRQRP